MARSGRKGIKLTVPVIAINLLSIGERPSGSKTYILSLLRELLPRLNERARPILIIPGRHLLPVYVELDAEVVVFPDVSSKTVSRVMVEQLILPLWLSYKKIDLLFAPRNLAPLLTCTPTVVGVLSLHLNYAANKPAPAWRRWLVHTLLRTAGRKAVAYIAISRFAGQTYLEMYGLDANRLTVAPLGFDRSLWFDRPSERPISEPYMLFVSTLHPHKNVDLLLSMMSVIQHPTVKLVIVGRDPDAETNRLRTLAQNLGVEDRIIFTGEVDDKVLHQYYRHALLFLFPSRTEGFGLTLLEAMAYGLPAISSNRTSLPEVIGDAGYTIDPDDVNRWALTVAELLANDALRSNLSARSIVQAAKFSWATSAQITASRLLGVLDDIK